MAGGRAARALVAVPALHAAVAAASSGYEDVVPKYCHIDKDWGPLPAKPEGATELIQVHTFIRHGARTQCNADRCWDGDTEGHWTCDLNYLDNSVTESTPLTQSFRTAYIEGRNAIAGNCMTGQLVKDGFEMEHHNGLRLREAYVEREGLLPATLAGVDEEAAKKLFSFRSTDVPRTKQSGMALFSGLYPASAMGTMPYIRLNTMDMSEESMLINPKICPAMTAVGENFYDSYPAKEELLAECRRVDPSRDFTKVSDCMALLGHVIDCLMSRICPTVPFSSHNTTVPKHYLGDGARNFVDFWRLADEAQWAYFKAATKAGGFAKFTEDFYRPAEQAVRAAAGLPSSGAPKLMLWSGHDTGPMEPLYAAFDLRTEAPYWPSFASMAVLELWKTGSGVLARWLSNGEVVATMPWEEFQRKAESVIRSGKGCHTSVLEMPPATSFMGRPAGVVATVAGDWSAAAAVPLQGVALIAFAAAASASLMTWGMLSVLHSTKKRAGFEDTTSEESNFRYH